MVAKPATITMDGEPARKVRERPARQRSSTIRLKGRPGLWVVYAAAIAAGILLLAGVSMAGGGEGELIQFSQNDHWLSVFTYYAFAQVPGVLGLTAAGSIGDSGSRELDGATGIATFKSGGKTYAAVASFSDDGVQVIRLNISPTVHAGSDQAVDEGEPVTLSGTAVDYEGDALTYLWTHDSDLPISLTDDTALSADFTAPQVTDEDSTVTFTLTVSDGAATTKDTVKVTITNILGVGPTLRVGDAGSIDRSDARGLNAATGIATFGLTVSEFNLSGNATYATVTSFIEGSVQIIDLSDPDNPAAAGSIGDSDTLNLGGRPHPSQDPAFPGQDPRADGIATFESGTTTYAAIASFADNGVQIIDLSDPDNQRAAASW